MKRGAPLKRTPIKRSTKPRKRRAVSPATPAQRQKVEDRACVVCRCGPCDPAHLIPRSLCSAGADDPRAVVPLCRKHHRQYDAEALSILEFLEPHWREELAFAVERVGLLSALQRITNQRWVAE